MKLLKGILKFFLYKVPTYLLGIITLWALSFETAQANPIENSLQILAAKAAAQNASAAGIDLLFKEYLKQFNHLQNKRFFALIDYNLPSTQKRFFLFDTRLNEVQSFLVAHGKSTGANISESFSNLDNSNKTSIGFFKTGSPYQSEKVGLALKLFGLDDSNSNAFSRGIVMHGAWYVSDEVIKKQGRIGRSLGCPALPPSVTAATIQKLKDGSLILAYHDSIFNWSESTIQNQSSQTKDSQFDQNH